MIKFPLLALAFKPQISDCKDDNLAVRLSTADANFVIAVTFETAVTLLLPRAAS